MIVALLPGKAGNNLKGLLSCNNGSMDPGYMIIMDQGIFIFE